MFHISYYLQNVLFDLWFDYYRHSSPQEPDKIFFGLHRIHVHGGEIPTTMLDSSILTFLCQSATKHMEDNPPSLETIAENDELMREIRENNLLYKFVATDDPKVEQELRTMLELPEVRDNIPVHIHRSPPIDPSKLN